MYNESETETIINNRFGNGNHTINSHHLPRFWKSLTGSLSSLSSSSAAKPTTFKHGDDWGLVMIGYLHYSYIYNITIILQHIPLYT